MLKRIFFPLTLLLCLAVATASCRDDDDGLIDLPNELVSGPIRISVPENPWRIKRAADYYALYVECQGSGWIATCESEWLTLTPTEGSESQYIRFDVEENTEPFARVAVITIADAKEPDTYRVQVRIRQSGYNDEDNATLTGDMQKRHRMGYGYDIMKEYASDGSYSNDPILDYDKVVEAEEAKGITIISEDRRHYQDLEIFSGTTITELAGQLTKSMDSKVTFLGCGKVSDTKIDIYRNKTIEEVCGLVRLKQIISSRTVDIGMFRSQATSDDSSLYSKEFRNALRELNENNAKSLFAKFGTHLVVSADLGGCLELHTTITRETSIETKHSVTTVTKKVFGENCGSSSKTYDEYQKKIGIDYKADLSCTGGAQEEHKKMIATINAKRQITPKQIIDWQKTFNIDPAEAGKKYNVGMIGCRLIPLYELINDPQKRGWVQAAFAAYTRNPEMAPKAEDTPTRIATGTLRDKWERESHQRAIRVYESDGTNRAVLAKEYVPAVRCDAPVIVAYPVVNGKPYFYSGVFIGDAEHRPGFVRWLGNNCLYEENDSISCNDSRFAGWFDDNKALKQLYFYNGAVHILPPADGDKYMADNKINNKLNLATLSINTKNFLSVDEIPLVKVGPWFWTESSPGYIRGIESDGGDENNVLTQFLPDGWDKYHSRFASFSQAQSLIAVCNGNTDALFDTVTGDGRNLMGLKWYQGIFQFKYRYHSGKIFIYNGRESTFLSRSGNAVLLEYSELLPWGPFFVPTYLATKEINK